MNANQSIWFREGAGCGESGVCYFTAENLLWAIQAIGTTVVFLFVAWLCYRAYIDYGEESISAKDMIIVWFRAVFVMMVLLYLLVN